MKIYQLQFQDTTLLWRAGPTFQMVPELLREFLNHLEDPKQRLVYGERPGIDSEYRVVIGKCHNPHYRYNGADSVTNLRDLGQM